jgi:hypothetical protein
MRAVTIMASLMIMVKLSGQGTENSLINPASTDKILVILTYYQQFLPDLESVTLLSNDQVEYATYYNRMKQGSLRNLRSHVKNAVKLIFRLAFNNMTGRDFDEDEIIIPIKLADGRSLCLFPEDRLIIAYGESTRTLPRIKPILITGSRLSVWFRITI